MDENTKLYVFSRKEVILIFLFILLVALTSFVLGVRVGKNFAFEASGLSQLDRERVDLLSGEEEKVNEVVKEVKNMVDEESKFEDKQKDVIDQQKIKERLEDLIQEETNKKKVKNEPVVEAKPAEPLKKEEPKPEVKEESSAAKQYSGKYTIQLGSHQSIEDAKAFAEGFRIRGYDPIINEVVLGNRGVWFRVSLGVFNTVTEAKNYVKKENSLFQGQEYHFARFE